MRQYMTADYLFRLGQNYLLNYEINDASRFLQLASEKGHEEAIWLISFMDRPSVYMENGIGHEDVPSYCHSLFENDDSVRALCYRLWFSNKHDFELIKYTADTGNAIGQYNYYTVLSFYDNRAHNVVTASGSLAHVYLEKAAAQDLVIAIRELAKLEEAKSAKTFISIYKINNTDTDVNTNTGNLGDRHMKLYLRGAELGDITCMKKMVSYYSIMGKNMSLIEQIDTTKWIFRSSVFFQDRSYSILYTDNMREIRSGMNLEKSNHMIAVNIYYTIGREGDGYDEFFLKFDQEEHDNLQEAIKFYRKINHAARKASLYAFWMLNPILSRDMAGIIAKIVYDSRLDPMKWKARGLIGI